MKTPTPPQTPVADWIEYLTYEYGYSVLTVSNVQNLFRALQRALDDLGAILGPNYAGLKLTHRSGKLLLHELIRMGIHPDVGLSMAILKRLRDYADRQILELQPNLLYNNYGTSKPSNRKDPAPQRVHAA